MPARSAIAADWPKTSRILRRADFERVYRTGRRFGSPLFTAFAARREPQSREPENHARVGFTTPRALGKAVVRNRVRRRLREVVRLHYDQVERGWDVIFNPRRALLDAPLVGIEGEVTKFFSVLQRGKQIST